MLNNPNNCETCEHKNHPDGGHCYMFRDEPTDVCKVHTKYKTLIEIDERLRNVLCKEGANHAE